MLFGKKPSTAASPQRLHCPQKQAIICIRALMLCEEQRFSGEGMKQKKGYKRGYPVAVLVGLENDHAVLWHVFSHVAKQHLTLKLSGKRTNEKALYNFHESVVDALRPSLKEGIRSIVVAAPMKTTYAKDFLDHVQRHHTYLIQSKGANRATFAELVGPADQPHKVA